MNETKRAHLKHFASALEQAARSGRLTGKPCSILHFAMVDGPRSGGLDITASFDDAGAIMAALVKNGCAALRGLVSWQFIGEPSCYFLGRALRVEAGWEDALASRDILVSSLTVAADVGQWVVGQGEGGRAVFASVSDDASAWLISGVSGSGKTVALFSAAAQLAKTCRVIILDMKGGRDLRALSGASGLVGPLVSTIEGARLALSWAVLEMEWRYAARKHDLPLVVICDELAALLDDGDCLAAFKSLLTRGREAGVHIIAATQYADSKTMGEPVIQKGFGGRIGLRVTSQEASRVALGSSSLSCAVLLGQGDAIVKSARGEARVQIARYDGAIEAGSPELAEWPEAMGTIVPTPDKGAFSGQELVISIIVASAGGGRPALQSAMAEAGLVAPGNGRGARLLELGRDIITSLAEAGFTVRAV